MTATKQQQAPAIVLEPLSEAECYLYAILMDHSGIDQAEFMWWDGSSEDGCWRAWPFQWPWWRCRDSQQIDLAARSIGKSLGIKARLCAFAFRKPGQEAVVTAPELIHLTPITDLVESQIYATRLLKEMLPKGRSAITHKPFMINFKNGARIIGRIPQRDGKGVKGIHPIQLEQDECFPAGTLILTQRGLVPIEEVRVGDMVLTHRCRWRAVTATFTRGERPAVIVRGQGHPGITCTPDHKFWGRKILQFKDQKNRWGVAKISDLGWQKAHTLPECFWSSPTSVPPSEPWPELSRSQTGRSAPIDPNTVDFAWALGLFLAEGSLSSGNGTELNRVYWSVHVDEQDYVVERLGRLGLPVMALPLAASDKCVNILIHHRALADWLAENVGRGASNKQIPVEVFGRSEEFRRAVLEGLVYGDGFNDPDERYAAGRWKLTTVSRRLAIGARLLAQSLGYYSSMYFNEGRPSTIRGRAVNSNGWYQVVGNVKGQGRRDEDLLLTRVREVVEAEPQVMYDLTVDEDHSFVAEGIVVSNSQDYPEKGWIELNETLKSGFEGAEWRAHGVTKGVHGTFYKRTQPESGWTVHKLTAMHRPNWTPEERARAIAKYGGSRDDPDFRRNVYGDHGDQSSSLFVMTRLAKCYDDDRSSTYNTVEYQHLDISDSIIDEARRRGENIVDELLVLPESHRGYSKDGAVWMGMDVGLTTDPSEILVFFEYHLSPEERRSMLNRKKAVPKEGESRMKLVARISLRRVTNDDQIRFILGLIDFYEPKGFALDRTGIGFPLWQDLQNHFRQVEELAQLVEDPEDKARLLAHSRHLKEVRELIKGYNFGEKVVAELDDDKLEEAEQEASRTPDVDPVEAASVERKVIEHSTDILRRYVDRERIWLPWDRELIGEFEGQTYTYSHSPIDQYGKRRRVFSEGKFHAFDAARMFAILHGQQQIEAIVKAPKKRAPVLDFFG